MDSVVLGITGDGSAAFLDDRILGAEPPPRGPDSISFDVDYLASVRGVLGVTTPALGSNVLVYATGGVAFTSYEISATNALNGTSGNLDIDEVGAVVGGGLEYAFTPTISIGAEYLHYFFGDRENLNRAPFTNNTDVDPGDNVSLDTIGVARAFINIKLDGLFGGFY